MPVFKLDPAYPRASGFITFLSAYNGERDYSFTASTQQESRSRITDKQIRALEKNHPIRYAFAYYRAQERVKRIAYRKRNNLTPKQFWELVKG